MSDEQTGLRALELIGIGSYVVACLLVCMGLGWLLDDWLGSMPVLTLVGLLLGMIAGTLGSWLRLRRLLV